jgi:hypothetical protein
MRPLRAWSLPRVLGVAFAWSGSVIFLGLLTPPGRFLISLYGILQAGGAVNVEVPVTALKIWFVIVPLLAFGPSAAILVAWLRERGVGGRKGVI